MYIGEESPSLIGFLVSLQIRGGGFFWFFACEALVALYTPCILCGYFASFFLILYLLIKKKKNGVIERKNKHLLNMAGTIMFHM